MHYHYLTIEQRESLEQQLRSSAGTQSELKAALEKLRQPDYGTCIECGQDIGYDRLQVEPFALHCLACSRLPITARPTTSP
jgi:RNA polymerase-binding transcription factor DksA